MTTAYTTLLGLALPVTGELSGTWGDTVNDSITSLLDTSVAGTTNVSTDANVTLTTTTGASNQARQAILLFSGARTAIRTVTAPAQSKIYTVINATTGGFAVTLVGAGPTTGLTIPNGASVTVAWNGSDFIILGNVMGGFGTNTAVGASALAANTSASNNTAFGNASLASTITGSANTALGSYALNVTTGGSNTGVGFSALIANTSGASNVSVGYQSLASNTTASNNTAVGYQALYTNTTGTTNEAFGFQAAYSNTTGGANVALGRQALQLNTTGSNNTGVGNGAINSNTTGGNNTALGTSALLSNTTASNITAVGYQALYSNTTGVANAAFGANALRTNTTGRGNYAFGNNAMYANTTGNTNVAIGGDDNVTSSALNANTTGSGNIAVGTGALTLNTTGSTNVGIGQQALQNNTTASNNTAVGYQAGNANTTGANNLFIGMQAAVNATTGTQNTFVGAFVAGQGGVASQMTTGSKNTILGGYNGNQGGLDIRTASNYIVLSDGDGNPRLSIKQDGEMVFNKVAFNYTTAGGYYNNCTFNSAGTVDFLNCYSTSASAYRFYVLNNGTINATSTTITGISDQRLKENIRDLDDGLDVVMALKPRKFDWKEGKGANIKNARGFIAQEFETVLPDMVEEWKDPAPEGEEPYKAVNANLIPTLVKAIQEQQAIIESLKARLDAANL